MKPRVSQRAQCPWPQRGQVSKERAVLPDCRGGSVPKGHTVGGHSCGRTLEGLRMCFGGREDGKLKTQQAHIPLTTPSQ